MSVSKVSVNGSTLIDISDTTATAADVSGNKVFYTASGVRTTGTGSGYVSKAGDTMTGELKAPVLTVESSGSWPSYGFIADAEEAFTANILFDNRTHRFNFVCKNSSTDTYSERYYLPAADSGLTENTAYDILTTKAPVTIPQGGTGATDAAGARTNLGLGDMATESKASYLAISELAANTDLNNVLTYGLYTTGSWSNMESLTHKPAQDLACLAVLPIVSTTNAAYLVQYWFGRSGLWRSDCFNGTWSVWTNITTGATVART